MLFQEGREIRVNFKYKWSRLVGCIGGRTVTKRDVKIWGILGTGRPDIKLLRYKH